MVKLPCSLKQSKLIWQTVLASYSAQCELSYRKQFVYVYVCVRAYKLQLWKYHTKQKAISLDCQRV